MRQLPRFDVDVEPGEIAAPPGGVAHLASAVRGVADLLGGRNVALVQFETNEPEAPLAITARAGGADPLVLTLGEEEFEMDPGWPDPPGVSLTPRAFPRSPPACRSAATGRSADVSGAAANSRSIASRPSRKCFQPS